MQDITKPNGNIKASPAVLGSKLVKQMRRERLEGLIYAIDMIAADPTLSEYQKEAIGQVLSEALSPQTGGVW